MRSKAGEVVCVGCGPVNKKKEEAPKKPEPITSSPEIIREQPKPKSVVAAPKEVSKIVLECLNN